MKVILVLLIIVIFLAGCTPTVRPIDIVLSVKQIKVNPQLVIDKLIHINGKLCTDEGHLVLMQDCLEPELGIALLRESDGTFYECPEECEKLTIGGNYRFKGFWRHNATDRYLEVTAVRKMD